MLISNPQNNILMMFISWRSDVTTQLSEEQTHSWTHTSGFSMFFKAANMALMRRVLPETLRGLRFLFCDLREQEPDQGSGIEEYFPPHSQPVE